MNQQQKNDILEDLYCLLNPISKALDDTEKVYSSTKTQMGGANSPLGKKMIQHGTTAFTHLTECAIAIDLAIVEVQTISTKSS